MNIKISMAILRDKLLYSVKLYPLASVFAVIFTVACLVLVDDHFHNETMQKIVYTSSFGFFLLSALYHWRRDMITLGSGLLLILLYFFSMPEYDPTFINKFFVLNVISFILLVVLPFLQKRGSNLEFWAWALNILLALISSSAFGFILYGGLAGAIKASSVLFEFTVNGKYYIYLFVIIMGLFSSHYFLAALKISDIDISKAFYNRFGNFFVKYILTSIASVYAVILSGYVLKIVLTQEWPNGILVWLSLVFASLSLATYLFWTPIGGKYRKLLIGVALVQLSLLFIAIYMRVSQYGWSSDRYMVTMLGIWFGVTFVYLIISKIVRYEYPFILLAFLLLISQYGWKLNAYEVSARSQTDRLIKLFADNSHFSNKTPKTVRCAISSALDLLEHHQNKEYLIEIMPETVKKYDAIHGIGIQNRHEYGFAQYATKELGFKYLTEWECRQNDFDNRPINRSFNHSWDGDESILIAGYDHLILHNNFEIDQSGHPNNIVIREKGLKIGEFDISMFAKRLMQTKNDEDMDNSAAIPVQDIPSELSIYSVENADIAIRIYFEYLNINEEGIVQDARGIVLMRKKHK